MNTKTHELRTLDDEELLGVVGGGDKHCGYQRNDCHPSCGCGGDDFFGVVLVVGLFIV